MRILSKDNALQSGNALNSDSKTMDTSTVKKNPSLSRDASVSELPQIKDRQTPLSSNAALNMVSPKNTNLEQKPSNSTIGSSATIERKPSTSGKFNIFTKSSGSVLVALENAASNIGKHSSASNTSKKDLVLNESKSTVTSSSQLPKPTDNLTDKDKKAQSHHRQRSLSDPRTSSPGTSHSFIESQHPMPIDMSQRIISQKMIQQQIKTQTTINNILLAKNENKILETVQASPYEKSLSREGSRRPSISEDKDKLSSRSSTLDPIGKIHGLSNTDKHTHIYHDPKKSPPKEKRRNSITTTIYNAVTRHSHSQSYNSAQASTHGSVQASNSNMSEREHESRDSAKAIYGLTGNHLDNVIKSHNMITQAPANNQSKEDKNMKLYTSTSNVKTKQVTGAIPINKTKKSGPIEGGKSEPTGTEELNPAEILRKISSSPTHYWTSPVVHPEIYIADVFFDGDETKLQKLMTKGSTSSVNSSDSSSEYIAPTAPMSTVASQDIFIDQMSKLQVSNQQLSSPTSTVSNELREGTNDEEKTSLSSSLMGNPNARSASTLPAAAPRLPKKPTPSAVVVELSSSTRHLTKFNSCSTLFTIDTTLFQPLATPKNLEITLKSVAHAVLTHLDRTYTLFNELLTFEANAAKAGGTKRPSRSKSLAARVIRSSDMLSEKLHPIWKARVIPDEVITHPEIMQAPTFDEVFLFLKQIFVAADLTAEIGIIMIIYLERMIAKTHITLHGINVFRALLGALMLASKVWDDQAVWNVDFKTIFVDLKLADLNQLERWWLGKVGFDISVQRGIYARYWFEIREVAEKLWGVRMSVLSSNMALARSHANMLKSNSKLATDKTKYDGASKTSLQVGNNSTRQSMNGGMESDNSKPSMQSVNTKSMSNMHPSHSKHYSVPKPQTEQHLQSVTLSTSSFSQSKIRENFTEQLSAPPTGSMLKVWENDADTKKKDRYSTGSYSTTPANGSIDNGPRLHNPVEKQASNTNVKKPSIYRDNTGSSVPTQITSAKVLPKPDDNGLKDTILNKLNTETNDFGWGGSNLRRAKSSDLYRPALPPASVL